MVLLEVLIKLYLMKYILGILLYFLIILYQSFNFNIFIYYSFDTFLYFLLFPIFFIYFISILAETNRSPFDLPEW